MIFTGFHSITGKLERLAFNGRECLGDAAVIDTGYSVLDDNGAVAA